MSGGDRPASYREIKHRLQALLEQARRGLVEPGLSADESARREGYCRGLEDADRIVTSSAPTYYVATVDRSVSHYVSRDEAIARLDEFHTMTRGLVFLVENVASQAAQDDDNWDTAWDLANIHERWRGPDDRELQLAPRWHALFLAAMLPWPATSYRMSLYHQLASRIGSEENFRQVRHLTLKAVGRTLKSEGKLFYDSHPGVVPRLKTELPIMGGCGSKIFRVL